MNMRAPDPGPVRTTCPYCGVGCGVLATPDHLGGATIAGDREHPSNFGRLCSKGSALGETLALDGRLLHPEIDGRRVSWDDALDETASGFRRVLDAHGPGAIAIYLSGQLLTEDYYAANKLFKGFLGSANVDTNSRLCMSSSVAGHKRAFGSDTVPGTYRDLETADLLVFVGSNAAWCHPVLHQRMLAARAARGTRFVVIDPRGTATSEEADLHLPIASGTDAILFSGLLVALAERGAVFASYVADHTEGFDAALIRARELAPSVDAVAAACGVEAAKVAAFYDLFAATERAVTLYSQGVNQSAQGTDKVGAILNVHLATGRIGREGMGPFSLTGQPNAMGGREVGGLANTLAAHMEFDAESIEKVRRFWGAPRMARAPGLKAVEMFEAIGRGEIKALWVMGTNPAASLPRADAVSTALRKLDLFVVSENVASNDTVNAGARIRLPAAAWGEKDGTVTNSERRISRQRPFLALPGQARPDWWAVAQVGRRLGFEDAFGWRTPGEVFREHAALSAFENDGTRDFDIGALAGLDTRDYDQLRPTQWPARQSAVRDETRFFAKGGYFTPNRRARFVAVAPITPGAGTDDAYPYRLNTGRVRDQWHTMTRTGKSPRLGSHLPEPFLEIHPDDAAREGVADGGFARVTSPHGAVVLRAKVDPGARRGAPFAPIHWTGETSSSGRVGALVHAVTDPFSGQPDAKATPVAVAPVSFPLQGFALARSGLGGLDAAAWWAKAAAPGGHGLLFALAAEPEVAALFPHMAPDDELVEYVDAARRVRRIAMFRNGALEACLFVGPARPESSWTYLRDKLGARLTDGQVRGLLLAGRASDGAATGPLVCACHGVPKGEIERAIASGCGDAAAVGAATRAGTNCGSCLPEIRRMLAAQRVVVEA
ncbi:nitrate reductase [Methylopila jiangsuensis]|uniref:Nitrate reductase n=1 Tax=Methylopila jiangsuensis TaxID=586230 RepID=A0A9W6N2X7_9HYPH|nr:nitrate reductase [Methylopila jiangsuensis]MDR6285914.1 assimilatory nitrate reductase catalytic subunit [Methylopila jiangsuensis]GLK75671.1 nitrate reductase [Methylopila jiangsuensis]